MALVTLTGGETGSEIELANNEVFYVDTGTVEFSTDDGTTFIPFSAGEKVVFSSALGVTPRNPHPTAAAFRHMPI